MERKINIEIRRLWKDEFSLSIIFLCRSVEHIKPSGAVTVSYIFHDLGEHFSLHGWGVYPTAASYDGGGASGCGPTG